MATTQYLRQSSWGTAASRSAARCGPRAVRSVGCAATVTPPMPSATVVWVTGPMLALVVPPAQSPVAKMWWRIPVPAGGTMIAECVEEVVPPSDGGVVGRAGPVGG